MSESVTEIANQNATTVEENIPRVEVNFMNDEDNVTIDKDEITKRLTQRVEGNTFTDTKTDIALTEKDLERYTKIDHLDEDPVVEINVKNRKYKQTYVLFSFISPEGVMNCNVRALKCRGCFETEKEAHEKVKELEKIDPYFKIFVAEVGKWVEFDPPASRVEKEASTDPKYQKILDSQAKMRMNKINAMVGKHKENVDNKESGKSERIKETKMSGASHSKNGKEVKSDAPKNTTIEDNITRRPKETTADRLKRRLAEKNAKEHDKKSLETLEKAGKTETISGNVTDLKQRQQIVTDAQISLSEKQDKIKDIDANINKIKQLMATKKMASAK